jgi:hypothetical protein
MVQARGKPSSTKSPQMCGCNDPVETISFATSAFKSLVPVPQFKATAKLGEFLSQLPA